MGSSGSIGDEWLAGWDATPGIVSVWAEPDGRVTLWRRLEGAVVREDLRFRPWVVTAHEDDVRGHDRISYRELAGEGALRWLARADDLPTLTRALLQGAARRLGHEL
ncbi:MAG TPA: hypothetical protein VIV58_18430, partial [Kofleriaceae bacterium]